MAALACQVVFNKLFQLAVVSHKGSMPDIHRKHTKVMGKILVAGKRSTLGVRGPGEKPSWGWDKIEWYRGEAHILQSLGTKGNQEGWPSWVEYRSGRTCAPHPGGDIFPDLSPRVKSYCGAKCSQGLRSPATTFIGKRDSSSTVQDLIKECDLVRYNTIL